MASKLSTDSPLSRRIARSFLHFLNSVEPSAGVDTEALDVAKECLAEVFNVDQLSPADQSTGDSLVEIFGARDANVRNVAPNEGLSDVPISSAKDAEGSGSVGQGSKTELHSQGKDELFRQFFDALEKIHYFRRMPDGSDDQSQLDRATYLFHNTVEEMQKAGCETFDGKSLAETFKSQGNMAMQSKVYTEAIELYTLAIALFDDNAVYYCNRAAAYTQIRQYAEAVNDCLKSIDINPNYSKAYSRLGFAYFAQGKYRLAIDKGFKKALQLDPNNESVKENIRAAKRKLREQQRRAMFGQSSFTSGGGSSRSNSTVPPSMPFNINGIVPEDITSLLINMGGNGFPGHPFENGPDGESETGAHNEPGVRINGSDMNVNLNDLPEELSGAFRSMMGGMFPGSSSQGNQQNDSSGRPAAS